MNKIKTTLLVAFLSLFSCKNTDKETSSVSEEAPTKVVKESPNQSSDNLNAEVIAEYSEQNQKFIDVPFLKEQKYPNKIKKVLVNAVGFGGNAVSLLISLD